MRYTRAQLMDITKGDTHVKQMIAKGRDPKASMNSLMSSLVAKGLSYREDRLSFHSSGRSEHTYEAGELMAYLGGYLAGAQHHNMCLKKAHAQAIFNHFEILGYTPGSQKNKRSKARFLREAIFGKAKSDEYYART